MAIRPPCFERTVCRSCRHSNLIPILHLGTPVLSDFIKAQAPNPPQVPLEMVMCGNCDLVQLRHTTDPELLYVKSYWYRSGINETMKAELADVVKKAVLMAGGIDRSDVVVDIGANDGTLLACYASPTGTPVRVAYEPALSLNDALRPHCNILMPELFPHDCGAAAPMRSAAVITSVAVFNHVDDPRAFVQGIDYLLADDGVWVMQVQDLAQQTQFTAYDNICHEHVTFYSLATFERLLEGFDLAVAAVEKRAINGGSLRFYVRRRKALAFPDTVREAKAWEKWLDLEALMRFTHRVERHKDQLVGTIDFLLGHDQEVDLYAASTKSSTLLQHCGIDHQRIRCAVERTPEKWGLVTSGTRIPIISEDAWRADPAPVLLIGAWQFASFFKQREAAFLQQGGRMLVPLPQTELVERMAEVI